MIIKDPLLMITVLMITGGRREITAACYFFLFSIFGIFKYIHPYSGKK